MAKSALQQRAEGILERFDVKARRPIVIEFAGVPKAGKTSTISQLQTFLKRCGFRVKVVIERASVCPIRDKKHFTFNVWTAATTLAQILENTQEPPGPEDPQILILDRGIFDSICWMTMMDRLSRVRSIDREKIENFLLLDEWRRRVTGVIVMTVSPEQSMKREQGLLPIEAKGSIMNVDVLRQMRETTKECIARMNTKFSIMEFDTSVSGATPQKTSEQVADAVLNMVEGELREDILHLPRTNVATIFGGKTTLKSEEAKILCTAFGKEGSFRPRSVVEDDVDSVQALPVVIVRNKSGDVLRLRRKEKDSTNPLNEKMVIWAGGHVRSEDGTNGEAVVRGAMRELQEELRLNIEAAELKLIGAIYIDASDTRNKKTRQHVAVVYEWRAETDDVAITLSTAEFFERRGTSLSGTFVPIGKLVAEIQESTSPEPWSYEILTKLLPESELNLQLF